MQTQVRPRERIGAGLDEIHAPARLSADAQPWRESVDDVKIDTVEPRLQPDGVAEFAREADAALIEFECGGQ